MAKYTKQPEIVDAVQWSKVGDAEGATIVAHADAEKDGKRLCARCGQPISAHGMRVLGPDRFFNGVCPGMWIITREDGRIEYLDDATFQARYTIVKE